MRLHPPELSRDRCPGAFAQQLLPRALLFASAFELHLWRRTACATILQARTVCQHGSRVTPSNGACWTRGTIILPRDRLHAVCCIGDIDAVSSGTYCWLAGTPPLPAHLLPRQKQKHRRSPSPQPPTPPPSPLSIAVRARNTSTSSSLPHHSSVQRIVAATLIADGQTAASAAAKAATSVSAARRWSKRLRTEPSADDAARSGRPRKTDALADGAIVTGRFVPGCSYQ